MWSLLVLIEQLMKPKIKPVAQFVPNRRNLALVARRALLHVDSQQFAERRGAIEPFTNRCLRGIEVAKNFKPRKARDLEHRHS